MDRSDSLNVLKHSFVDNQWSDQWYTH